MSGWYTEDDGGPVAGLDGAFRNGHAPKLHGMLKKLNEANMSGPVWVDEPWNNAEDDDRELRSTTDESEVRERERPFRSFYPILQGSAHGDGSRDLTIEEFFHHADILSGQDIGTVEPYGDRIPEALKIQSGGWITDAVDILEHTRASADATEAYDDLDIFGEESAWWGENWTDKQGRNAKTHSKRIDNWYENYRQPALDLLTWSLVRYGAIMHGARLDLNNLMGECVSNIEAFDARHDSGRTAIGWQLLSGIANVASAGYAAPVVAAVEMQNFLDEANSAPIDKADGFYGTLVTYLRKADQLLADTADAVETLTRNLKSAFPDDKIQVPTWS